MLGVTRKRVWISSYALSKGITEHEAEIRDNFAYPGAPFAPFIGFAMGKDAHATREEAVAAAETQRKKRVASLKKQLARLEKLTF